MTIRAIHRATLLAALASSTLSAQGQRSVGIVPFDVTSIEGSGVEAGRVLATLVRVELLNNQRLLPRLIKLPEGARLPLQTKDASTLGRDSEVEFIVVGTVLEASSARSNNRATTRAIGKVLGGAGAGVSGSLTRTTAKVTLHVQLVPSKSSDPQAFEVSESHTDIGVGADLHTTLGAFSAGDAGWQKTPMGKALRDAARKISVELAQRIAKMAS
jgi:hypothetical protein